MEAVIAQGNDALERVKKIQWVVKLSKFCNLRCVYCYEFNSLDDAARITLDQVRYFFENVRDLGVEDHEFIWHGGEPTLLPCSFFEEIARLQGEIFGARGGRVTNRIQTNLFRLSEEWFRLFRSGVFNSIGVSFDIFGQLRSSKNGRNSHLKVIENIDRLRLGGVPFGIITVLNRENLAYCDEIFEFCKAFDFSFRMLPIYREAQGRSNADIACSREEVQQAIVRISDRWLQSDSKISVQPITGALRNIQKFLRDGHLSYYDKQKDCGVFVVDTDGTLYGTSETYDPRYAYLNVFSDDLRQLSASPGWIRSVDESRSRVREICSACSFFGVCNGNYVAEATPMELDAEVSGALRCGVPRTLHLHLIERLGEKPAQELIQI